ncbi:sulfatase-like hydrolase/transferase [Psychrosphaera algicola]|uniref:Sulfatase-like hydrolase/transferase n=1 Tax=Psychrosphaera algicola TaxID=3023714 RepID=A0ABT5FC87_9GAMM|nr:sulfatase-like hydrolase/transferase [Psychrosphaera sp. G1-22]MDC2889016.1 sulfatase-like hydrolase/transferase [Psychrosphaera sp. G1-22]
MIRQFVSFSLIGLFSAVAPVQAADKPNILFIFADDLGWGDLGIHGSKTIETPNLDQLAAQGSEFYQFTVANPVCSPSRAGLITGNNPARHSVHHHFAATEHHQKYAMPDWLEPSVLTIPKVMKKAGYTTAHFGKWHLTNSHIPDAPLLENYGYDESAVFNGPSKQTDGWKVYDDTIEFIERNKNKPFFINLWIHEPHTPHYPDPKMMKKYAHLGEQQQVYAAVVEGADERIGRVLQALKDNGLEDNTIVVFSSDNGAEEPKPDTHRYLRTDPDAKIAGIEPLGRYFSVGDNAGLRGAKRYTYEGGVRVPLIVKWPGKVPAGIQNTTSLVTAVDFLPTFADLVDVKLPRDYKSDGESILPQLTGELVKRKKPIFGNGIINLLTKTRITIVQC